jgi:hypothetical protein
MTQSSSPFRESLLLCARTAGGTISTRLGGGRVQAVGKVCADETPRGSGQPQVTNIDVIVLPQAKERGFLTVDAHQGELVRPLLKARRAHPRGSWSRPIHATYHLHRPCTATRSTSIVRNRADMQEKSCDAH